MGLNEAEMIIVLRVRPIPKPVKLFQYLFLDHMDCTVAMCKSRRPITNSDVTFRLSGSYN